MLEPYQNAGIHLDIGTGDGTYAYRQAQKNPQTFFIGLDCNADNLRERSQKAARSLRKGGLGNLLYGQANVESLPEELQGLVSHISILFPWGSLLRVATGQDITLLKSMAKLCRAQATIQVIFGYESQTEQSIIDQLGLPQLTPEYLNNTLPKIYSEAGFTVKCSLLQRQVLKTFDTTWAKKLAYGKERQFVEIRGLFCSS